MAVTKKEADGEHPASHYLVVEKSDQPSTWHLRVKDASGKLDTRLLGAAHAALTKGFRGNKYGGPNKQAALARLKRLYSQAGLDWPGGGDAEHSAELTFSAEEAAGEAGDLVLRRGLIFRCGDYEDKGFALSADEALDAIAEFEPVPVDLEHTSTPLDGQLGELRSVELDPDGERLFGTVALPRWLDSLLPERRVSTTWDRVSKRLRGLALVRDPRVPDAALLSAYADFARPQHRTPTGQMHLQMLHQMTIERGAVCAPPEKAQMASRSEARIIQDIHDMTTAHGASCESMDAASRVPLFGAQKEKRRMTIDFKALFSGLFGAIEEQDESGGLPAPVAPAPVAVPTLAPARAQDQGYLSVSSGTNSLAAPGIALVPGTPAAPTAAETTPDPRIAELEKQLAERDAALAKAAAERILHEASTFAEEQVRAGKILPAQRDGLAALAAQALRDDAAAGPVTFTGGDGSAQTITRLEQLRALLSASPGTTLTTELLPTGQDGQQAAGVVTNPPTTPRVGPDGKRMDGPMSEERKRALLAHSALGRAISNGQSGR